VPFRALETFQTWTDLYQALYPNNLGKSGAIYWFAQSVPTARIDPTLRPFVPQMIANRNLPAVRDLLRARSSLQAISGVATPTFVFQGRRDFAFDIDQAVPGYRALAGPKRLYIGDFGHWPSTFPGPDLSHVLDLSTRWYERFLEGIPNGVDREKRVQIAADPWNGRAASFTRVPTAGRRTFVSHGRFSLSATRRVVRTFRPLQTKLEQFGAPILGVIGSTTTRWPHLVAVVTAVDSRGKETVLSEGGALSPFGGKSTRVAFRLISSANFVPRGARLRVYLGATSTVQGLRNLLYVSPVPESSRLTITRVSLRIPVLPKAISG
jgi:hypothetical protein